MSEQGDDDDIIEVQSYCVKKQTELPQRTTCILITDDNDYWSSRSRTPLALTIVEIDEAPSSSSMKRVKGDDWTLPQWERTGARPKQYKRRLVQRLPPRSLRCPLIRPHLLRIPRLPYLLSPVHYDRVEDSYLAPVIPAVDQCFPDLTVYHHHLRQLKLLDKIPELQEPEENS